MYYECDSHRREGKVILPYVFVAAVVLLGVGLWIWPTLFGNEAIMPSDVRELGNQVLGEL